MAIVPAAESKKVYNAGLESPSRQADREFGEATDSLLMSTTPQRAGSGISSVPADSTPQLQDRVVSPQWGYSHGLSFGPRAASERGAKSAWIPVRIVCPRASQHGDISYNEDGQD
jgi:hypothetical protein